jgi:orotidine-5'-phosphate decarboxylase
MTRLELFENIKAKKSFLCVGLDTDIALIPEHLLTEEDPIFEFNKQIIDATHDICVAYKPNSAFYESLGYKGWQSLEKTVAYINSVSKTVFTIADAKRGDIGNTSKMYAQAFFERMNFDSITVAPYMGEDSVVPFLEYPNKWVILLALTSNKGAADFQLNDSSELYKQVLNASKKWGTPDNLMYVVGATKAEMLAEIRKIVPDSFLLIPGVGAQGGSLSDVVKYGMNKECGLLVNSSRSIIYASKDHSFAVKAREEAVKLQKEMELFLKPIL